MIQFYFIMFPFFSFISYCLVSIQKRNTALHVAGEETDDLTAEAQCTKVLIENSADVNSQNEVSKENLFPFFL